MSLRDFVIVQRARPGPGPRLHRADRRDRRRQVHPDRRAAAGAGQPRRRRRGARRRRARRGQRRVRHTRQRWRPGWKSRLRQPPTPAAAPHHRRQGKSRAWINGSPATATQLREAGEHLVDIHGQHAWQSLTRPAAVRACWTPRPVHDTSALGRCGNSGAWPKRRWLRCPQRARHAAARARTPGLADWRGRQARARADEWDELNTSTAGWPTRQALLDGAGARGPAGRR
jgi:hypothetical protein